MRGTLACASQVNLLSKVDLVEAYGELAFALDFYTDVLDPSRLLPLLLRREGKTPFARRHQKLNQAVVRGPTDPPGSSLLLICSPPCSSASFLARSVLTTSAYACLRGADRSSWWRTLRS